MPKVISSSLEIGWRLAEIGASWQIGARLGAANGWIRTAIRTPQFPTESDLTSKLGAVWSAGPDAPWHGGCGMMLMLDERFDRMGDVRLTARQSACVALVARGMSSKEIARELGISPSTVDNHIATAMHQFGFPNRSAVARWYLDYRDSATASEMAPMPTKSNSRSYVNLLIPTLGGIRNSLSVKERLFAILQVMIVSIMVTSAAVSLVLGLIFFLKLAR